MKALLGIVAVLFVIAGMAMTRLPVNATATTASGMPPAARSGSLESAQTCRVCMYLPTRNGLMLNQEFCMNIENGGLSLTGRGRDNFGNFALNGEVSRGGVSFQKTYEGFIPQSNWPVVFNGSMSSGNGAKFASGNFVWRQSGGKPSIRGFWEALIPNPTVNLPTSIPTPANLGITCSDQVQKTFSNASSQEPQAVQTAVPSSSIFEGFCLNVLQGSFYCLIPLLGAYFLMVKVFGPSGFLSVRDSRKYIPSQYKREHGQMLSQFSKQLSTGGLPLGVRREWSLWNFWTPRVLNMPPSVRDANPHMLILGSSGKGKTHLMASMIGHDIKSGDRAVVMIDSDGTLSQLVTKWLSTQQADYYKRLIVIDPTDRKNKTAFNPLDMTLDGDMQSAATAVVHGFEAIYRAQPGAQSEWNPQTENILRNACLLLMATGRTLADLPELFANNEFRDMLLDAVEHKRQERTEYISLLENWSQYKKIARGEQWILWVEPILNHIGPMLSDERIGQIISKPVSDLNFTEIIKQKQILIVKVPKGILGENASLFASLVVTGLVRSASALSTRKSLKQRKAALYVDEMNNYIDQDMIKHITSETDRYQIGLTASLKTLQQLPDTFRQQLLISVGTIAVFSLAKKDGDLLGPQMFRVDGRKIRHHKLHTYTDRMNIPRDHMLIVTDEEKQNIDRVVAQDSQHYFCYQVGSVAGVFQLKANNFNA